MFIWNSKDLNQEQSDAIKESGNVLLVACPGSGKTRTLTYKIAFELSKLKGRKKYLIAITYTHRAADEIRERVELLGIDTAQLWIGTIHSFCVEWILKPYALHLDELKNGFRIINSHETEELLNELCAPYQKPKITSFDCAYILEADGYRLSCNNVGKHSDIDAILKKYWQTLSERKLIDFQLILYLAYKLIELRPTISRTLSKIFSHILLDEYQDTSEIQYLILTNIIRANNTNLKTFIVGDPNQSIYTSLGGYAIKLENLEHLTGSKFKPLTLTGNYRSSNLIINYFDGYKTYFNSINGCGKHKDYQSTITLNNTVLKSDLQDEITRLILYNIEQKGISPNEICVVAPQWVHLASLTRSLMIKLPNYSFNGPGMAPFSRDIDNFFYKLCRIALTEPAPNLYLSRLRWSGEILADLEHLGISVAEYNRKHLLRICNSFHSNEIDGLIYLRQFFADFFDNIKVSMSKFEMLTEDYASFFKSAEDRITRLTKEGNEGINTIENFRKVFKQREGITISTIHGVKGAEYDAVIAFALLQDYIPHFSDLNGDDSAKKLLYVISSRARLNLHLIAERGRFKNYGTPPPEYFITNQLASRSYTYHNC